MINRIFSKPQRSHSGPFFFNIASFEAINERVKSSSRPSQDLDDFELMFNTRSPVLPRESRMHFKSIPDPSKADQRSTGEFDFDIDTRWI